jgi:FkbM family methyltransferase
MEHFIKNLFKYINHRDGFYIECGANDGVFYSYTYELEKLNWNGILIEPSIKAFDECIKNRSKNNFFYNCALVSSDNIKEIYGDFDGSCMSSVNGDRLKRQPQTKVECRTLTSILKELNISNIDLFSLDVEGYEMEVLKGLNFNIYSPQYILIEVYENNKNEIFSFMTKNNYDYVDNITGYNITDFPYWDGTHNDLLFVKK